MDEVGSSKKGSPNAEAGAVELVWPPGLLSPARPPKLMYLDLNHWINLSKARLGRGTGARYGRLLESCRSAVSEGRVRIVLSDTFFAEFPAIPKPQQRTDLVDLVDELTEFEYLAGHLEVIKLEMQATLDAMTNTRGHDFSPIGLVGGGLLYSFGMVGGLRIVNDQGSDVTQEELQRGGPESVKRFKSVERYAERKILAGPSDEEVQGLRANGYAPEIARQSLINNVHIEQAFADMLDRSWRRGRLRDVLMAREISLELKTLLFDELELRGLTFESVATPISQARQLVMSMPSSCVTVELKTHYHRDPNKRWRINDLYDIHALAVAVPYCDIVFTDAAVRRGLIVTKLDQRMSTLLPRTPDELADLLDAAR